jgi:hypothetical protein
MKARICIGGEIKYGSGSRFIGESGPKSKPKFPITQKVEKNFQFDKNRTFAINAIFILYFIQIFKIQKHDISTFLRLFSPF